MRRNTLLIGLLVVLMLVVWTAALTGCKPRTGPGGDAALPDVPPPGEAPGGAAGEPAPTEFAWTDAPSLPSIPDGVITGVVNGEPFEAKTVRVKQGENGGELEISNVAVDEPTDVIVEDTGISLRFPIAEGTTDELVKTFDDNVDFDMTHSFYWYPQGGDKGPMPVNPTWACALQVSDWVLAKDADDEDILGNVKGKLAITFDDDEKSWVAGSFDCVYYKW